MAPSGPYLAERFNLTLVPSAAIWLALRTRRTHRVAWRSLWSWRTRILAGGAAREADARGERLEALTQANQEGERAVQAFPSGSRLISGPAATKGSLLSMDLAPFALVHFATHSLIDPVAPERSAIVLASASAADDGLLRVETSRRSASQARPSFWPPAARPKA